MYWSHNVLVECLRVVILCLKVDFLTVSRYRRCQWGWDWEKGSRIYWNQRTVRISNFL